MTSLQAGPVQPGHAVGPDASDAALEQALQELLHALAAADGAESVAPQAAASQPTADLPRSTATPAARVVAAADSSTGASRAEARAPATDAPPATLEAATLSVLRALNGGHPGAVSGAA